ncbi:MAG: glycosyltransferase family 2 protein [Caldilineaceae bacterium]|nr:glycosyltransferase family 2 protein [Caldilineaceae bacterium]
MNHPQAAPQVAVVILNWNNTPDTLVCLASVFALDYPNLRVAVVDNGSTDASVELIAARFPDATLLALGENRGYAAGNNAGMAWALALGVDYVLVLNNDTRLAPDMLAELVRFAEAHPQAGMVGPTMYCMPDEQTVYAAGSFVDWAKGRTWNRGMYQPAQVLAGLRRPEQVDFITGCGVLVRRSVLERAGLLDTRYFLNYEDVEWAVRARRHGFEVWYVPSAVMWHKDSATFVQGSPAHIYYLTRNGLLFFRQNSPAALRWWALARFTFTTLRIIGAWTFKPAYQTDLFRRRRQANLLALRDFALGRFDQMGPDVAAICYPTR